MEEPSVLDYLKSILNPWSKEKVQIPSSDKEMEEKIADVTTLMPVDDLIEPEDGEQLDSDTPKPDLGEATQETAPFRLKFPWLLLAAVIIAIISQRMLEPPDRSLGLALAGYAIAAAFLLFETIRSPNLIAFPESPKYGQIRIKGTPLIASFILTLISFFAFGNHQFSSVNLLLWLTAISLGCYALWQSNESKGQIALKIKSFLKKPEWRFRITPWHLLVLLSITAVIFFRFYRLDEVPGEMFSDHAEKLMDVSDVLSGNLWTFFPRNTGREALQMYLTAAVALVFGTGLSFMSLKIGTALAGFLTLPFVYLLGKEIGNRWTGLLAFLFAGMAYWPNVISRIGLRFPLYPLFVAPVLYFLIRGLRRSRWNDFILAGLFLGLGLHGYSPIRFLPFVVTAAIGLYLIHPQSNGNRRQTIFAYFALAFVAFLVFIPLLRYWVDDPMMFNYRALTRMGTVERSFSEPVFIIFLSNFWKAITMFFWDNGGIWVHSVTGRPALGVIPAALFLLSIIYLVIRYVRKPNWQDLFFLLSVPLLMMPSILSLAFPDENPSLNRTGGAIVPVFVMVALLLEYLISKMLKGARQAGKVFAILFIVLLVFLASNQDFNLVFTRFDQQFMAGAWNTSEIGEVIRGYVDSTIGTRDSAYVVPFPHWVDTRLVGINAGFPEKDYALWPDRFIDTLTQPGAKLFLLKSEDQDSVLSLLNLYPHSSYWLYQSKIPGKDFWVLLVPPEPSTFSLDPVEDPAEQ